MTDSNDSKAQTQSTTPSQLQIFIIFFKLGCIAFGGPAAHLVFFHQKFVHQLKWLTDDQYSQLVALSQIIPGPSSSQVGIAIGYLSKGYSGAISAWLGFTLPSFFLMTTFAYLGQHFFNQISFDVFHILKLIVLAIVIFAFWQMLKSFCKTIWQYLLMLASALFIYVSDFSFNQIILIFIAVLCGLIFSNNTIKKKKKSSLSQPRFSAKNLNHQNKIPTYVWLILFFIPFIVFPLINNTITDPSLKGLESFYYSSSMVFGGGHIILPLLHQDFVGGGLVSNDHFDLGYALVQLMPGPLFSFASYLGALLPFSNSIILNAAIGTIAIFLPSFFLIFGTLPYWSWLMNQPKIYKAVEGINAAVIGLLLCLIIQMTEQNIKSWIDIVFVILVVMLLKSKLPVALSIILSFSTYYLLLSY